MRRIDRVGQRYGRLVVIGLSDRISRDVRWRCRCDCGRVVDVFAGNLARGNSTSCGCYRSETLAKVKRTHGHAIGYAISRTYRSWRAMKTRCLNAANFKYVDYGARGIAICDRWIESFENFLADMGERPPGTSIDRIDVNGNYEPGNCRWATGLEQAHNKRVTA